MATLIIYLSKHGTTEKCAHILKDNIEGSVALHNFRKDSNPDLSAYNQIIIGGSIHLGRIPGKLWAFCEKNMEILLTKKIGLYICCMYKDEIAQQEFDSSYPELLKNHSSANGIFGGEFLLEKMHFIDKMIVKSVSKITTSQSEIDYSAIETFVKSFKL